MEWNGMEWNGMEYNIIFMRKILCCFIDDFPLDSAALLMI